MITLDDRIEIMDVCTRMMWCVDTRAWDVFPTVFAEKVTLDYTRLWGGEPQQASPAEVTAGWRPIMEAFEATQHLLGNHLVTVDGDAAELTAVFQATHTGASRFGSPVWTLGGLYRFGLVKVDGLWKINHVEMTPTWADGNKEVVNQARAAAA